MVLYIQSIYEYGTLLLPRNALVKSKKQMTTISTSEAVEKQSKAMGTKAFEIGLFDPRAAQGVMLPRVWELETLLRSVSWLRLKNAEGRNIYIRPSGEHSLSLIDDATIQVIERLKSEGFAPAIVLETSPGNFQAWLHHGQILPKHLSTLAARLLASRFGGDLASADWRHYGRLAGFTNRKDKHRKTDGTFPYVRLHEATGAVYSKAIAFLAEVKTLYEAEQSKLPPPAFLRRRSPCRSNLKSIQDFRTKPIMRRATRSLPVILRTKAIGNDNKSILIARLRRLGTESNTIGKANDLLSKTQHSSRVAAGGVEGIEGHPKAFCHIVDLPKVKFDGLGPVANRFYETLQRGRANLPKPVDCHQITDRQKPEPYSETGTCGAIFASALAAEPRPRQHLTLQQFLAPLTAPRCPLLGNNPLGRIRLSEKWHDGCPNRRSRGQSLGNIGPTSVHHVPLFPTHRRTRNGYRSKNSPKSFGTTKPSSPT